MCEIRKKSSTFCGVSDRNYAFHGVPDSDGGSGSGGGGWNADADGAGPETPLPEKTSDGSGAILTAVGSA